VPHIRKPLKHYSTRKTKLHACKAVRTFHANLEVQHLGEFEVEGIFRVFS